MVWGCEQWGGQSLAKSCRRPAHPAVRSFPSETQSQGAGIWASCAEGARFCGVPSAGLKEEELLIVGVHGLSLLMHQIKRQNG